VKVTVNWWTGWGSQVLGKLPEKFNADNPDIEVVWRGSVDQEAFLTAYAGGTPPEAATLGAYPELFARGAAIALTDRINASKTIQKDDIYQSSWDGATYQGQIYAIPAVEGFLRYGLCYNTDLVKGAGLDPARPPETWDDAYEWHKAMTQFDSAGNVKVIGFDPLDAMGDSIGFGDPWMWPKSWGFVYYDEKAQKFDVDRPEMVEAFGVIKKFYDLIGAEKMAAFRQSYGTWTGPNASIVVETEGAQINGYWTPGEIMNLKPEVGRKMGYSWIPVPASRKGKKVQSAGGHYLFIPKGSKAPDQAFRYGEFLISDAACDIIYDGLGWLPARKSYNDKVDVSKYPGLDWFVKSAIESNDFTATVMDPITQITYNKWQAAYNAVIYGDKTPEQAPKDMQQELTDELQKFLSGG
jgi:multiple sugar transport system substrate-binding protein